MEKIDTKKLVTFYHVAVEGSYQKASVHLGVKTSYISKQITSLEDHLKFKLFKRSHRSLVLTEKAEELLKYVQIMMNQLEKIEEISNENEKDEDIIRIVTTTGVTNIWLVQKLKEFSTHHPKYKLRIIAVDDRVDVASHYADVAILPKVQSNPNVVQKKLFTFHTRLYATNSYVKEFGIPKTTADLDNHRLISYYHNEAGHRGDLDWHLRIGTKDSQPRTPFLVMNSALGLYEALIQGLGIVVITEEFPYFNLDCAADCSNRDALVKILPEEGVEIPIFFASNVLKMNLNKVMLLEKFFRG